MSVPTGGWFIVRGVCPITNERIGSQADQQSDQEQEYSHGSIVPEVVRSVTVSAVQHRPVFGLVSTTITMCLLRWSAVASAGG